MKIWNLKNLLTLMNVGFESEIWIAPLLRYYNKFRKEKFIGVHKKNLIINLQVIGF